jgi:phosphoglycerate dehydrogenase-like enzyme
MEIGIVGYGQMGKFMASLLSPLFADIKCYDPKHNLEKEIKNPNVTFSTLKETCLCDIVFLFPPISEFRQCCQSISRLIQPEAIVVES